MIDGFPDAIGTNLEVLGPAGQGIATPALFASSAHDARRFWEFFTANIRNPHTRRAYFGAIDRFATWCDRRRLDLQRLEPILIAAYIEELGQTLSKPSVKQHLAASRMLFDWMVLGQVVRMNPASAVCGPKYVIKKGKTPVLLVEEARDLLQSIETNTVKGLRDRALLAVMSYTFARVGAVIGMRVEDYFQQGKRWWFRLHEKGGKHHEIPAHHKAEAHVDAWIAAAGIGEEHKLPLFRTFGKNGMLTKNPMGQPDVMRMIKKRAVAAGLPYSTRCHTFRATGITAYLGNGGTLEGAGDRRPRIAAHHEAL